VLGTGPMVCNTEKIHQIIEENVSEITNDRRNHQIIEENVSETILSKKPPNY